MKAQLISFDISAALPIIAFAVAFAIYSAHNTLYNTLSTAQYQSKTLYLFATSQSVAYAMDQNISYLYANELASEVGNATNVSVKLEKLSNAAQYCNASTVCRIVEINNSAQLLVVKYGSTDKP